MGVHLVRTYASSWSSIILVRERTNISSNGPHFSLPLLSSAASHFSSSDRHLRALKKKKKATSNCLFFCIRCRRIRVSMMRESTLCGIKIYDSSVGGVLLS